MLRNDITKEQCLSAMSKTKSVRAAARYLGVSYTHMKRWMKLYEATEEGYSFSHASLCCQGINMLSMTNDVLVTYLY